MIIASCTKQSVHVQGLVDHAYDAAAFLCSKVVRPSFENVAVVPYYKNIQ